MSTTLCILTPFEITFLLHVYAIAEPFKHLETLAGKQAVCRFIAEGLIAQSDNSSSGFKITERGTALVDKLCSTPFPKQVWI